MPYSERSLGVRLGREPGRYSWPHMLLGERAFAGMWEAGIRVHRSETGRTREDTRVRVLHHGCLPGAEGELVALLEAWCARLARGGTAELAVFTSVGSRAREALLPLAKQVEPYGLGVPIPEPADLAARGVYTDQPYF